MFAFMIFHVQFSIFYIPQWNLVYLENGRCQAVSPEVQMAMGCCP